MEGIDFGKEISRAAIAALVAFFAGLALQAIGAGRWVVAGMSGAVGGLAAVAVVA
jgi:hypothetical protein